jgi:hypothetical protein
MHINRQSCGEGSVPGAGNAERNACETDCVSQDEALDRPKELLAYEVRELSRGCSSDAQLGITAGVSRADMSTMAEPILPDSWDSLPSTAVSGDCWDLRQVGCDDVMPRSRSSRSSTAAFERNSPLSRGSCSCSWSSRGPRVCETLQAAGRACANEARAACVAPDGVDLAYGADDVAMDTGLIPEYSGLSQSLLQIQGHDDEADARLEQRLVAAAYEGGGSSSGTAAVTAAGESTEYLAQLSGSSARFSGNDVYSDATSGFMERPVHAAYGDEGEASNGSAAAEFLGLKDPFSGDGWRNEADKIGEEELYRHLAENDEAVVPYGVTLERHLAQIIYR